VLAAAPRALTRPRPRPLAQLISVNPFKQINGLYTPGLIKAYHNAYSYERAPHVYGPAEETFRSLLSSGRSQCMLVSGESGAGKTEATKRVLEYISAVSSDSASGRSVASIKDKLLESNPVMEAFGNAKTLRNDNSSRFGKYMVIQFDYSGAPLGATINTYLLEKPRIVGTQDGERGFHIFYNLCAGARGNVRSELGLSQASDYKYLGKTLTVKGMNDEADFGEVDSALDVLVGAERKKHMYRVVASVLHLGNVTFKPSGDKQEALGCDMVARLLDVDLKKLQKSLTYKTIRTRGEVVSSPIKPDECVKTRDALAKAVYARAFKQLVSFLNEALLADAKVELTFGLLDIFGFEIFERNSFEQLLINYTNERLQQIFVQLTLESEQREYAAEGLKWQPIPFFNNQIVVDLIEAKKPAGVLAYVDEESIMPQGRWWWILLGRCVGTDARDVQPRTRLC
jgi:myosin-1